MTDTVRNSLEWVLLQLIEAEATAVIGAAHGERTESRTNQRNGHRPGLLSTQAGDVELEIPKLGQGSFFPSLLERRRRIGEATGAHRRSQGLLRGQTTPCSTSICRAI